MEIIRAKKTDGLEQKFFLADLGGVLLSYLASMALEFSLRSPYFSYLASTMTILLFFPTVFFLRWRQTFNFVQTGWNSILKGTSNRVYQKK